MRQQHVQGRGTVNSAEVGIACCIAGMGLIQIPAYDVRDELAAGTLLDVMPGYRTDLLPISLLYPHRRHPAQRLQVVMD